MINLKMFRVLVPVPFLILATLACGLSSTPAQADVPVAPISVGGDLSKIDLCQAIPKEDIEAVMGRKLVGTPQHFEISDTPGETSGCTYDTGKDSNGDAFFGYVVLTPVGIYDHQPLYQNADVSGLGDGAYFNNGADARQLWVKLNGKVAFVVAFGDSPNEAGAKTVARLMLAALK